MSNELKIARGNPNKESIAALAGRTPQPRQFGAIPPSPVFLSLEAQQEWNRLAPELVRAGLLTTIDIGAFAAYCSAYGDWRSALAEGRSTSGPMRTMLKFAGEFGLTPASRARLRIKDTPPPMKFPELQ